MATFGTVLCLLTLSVCVISTSCQFWYEGHLPVVNRLASIDTQAHRDFMKQLVGNYSRAGSQRVFIGSLDKYLNPSSTKEKDAASSGNGDPQTLLWENFGDLNFLLPKGFTASDQQCAADMKAYVALLNRTEWGIQMADASGKPQGGILTGSVLFLGNFDECRKVKASYNTSGPPVSLREFGGRYCTGSLAINFPLLPKLGNYKWGLCLPDSCSDGAAVVIGNWVLQSLHIPFVNFVAMECHEKSLPWSARAIGVLSLVGFFAVLVVLGTLVEIFMMQAANWGAQAEFRKDLGPANLGELPHTLGVNGSPDNSHWRFSPPQARNGSAHHTLESDDEPLILTSNPVIAVGGYSVTDTPTASPNIVLRLLLSFSVWTNGKKLLNTKQPAGTISCVNGIRVISINWVVLGHTALMLEYVSGNVLVYSSEALRRWSFQVIINGTYSVDTFFVLSGLLVSYLTLNELRRSAGKLNWIMFYVHRYLRLTPVYMIIMGIWISTLPYFLDGPMFPQHAGFEKDFCKDTWWGNLLYVQNLVKYKSGYCFAWAWYLAVDMQFYVISPLIIAPLYFKPRLGYVMMGLFFLMTTITPFVLTETRYYAPSGDGFVKVKGHPKSLGDLNYDLYISPYCRMGPYLVGMLLGYVLHRTRGRQVRIHWLLVLTGWVVATATALAVIYGLTSYMRGAEINLHVSALYNALSRTAWGVSVAWVIFCCVEGYGGVVNTFLSWKIWIPLGRLTYCVYLLHIIIIGIYGTTSRTPLYLNDMTIAWMYLSALFGTYAVSLVASLMFESPFVALERVLLKRDKRS